MTPIVPPARVEVNERREYIDVDQAACELLGYSRDELLAMSIDDVCAPSGAHVRPMFDMFVTRKKMEGLIALRKKTGEMIWVRYTSTFNDGRYVAVWTDWAPAAETRSSEPA